MIWFFFALTLSSAVAAALSFIAFLVLIISNVIDRIRRPGAVQGLGQAQLQGLDDINKLVISLTKFTEVASKAGPETLCFVLTIVFSILTVYFSTMIRT